MVSTEESGYVQKGDIRINHEIDRTFIGTAGAVELRSPDYNRTILVEKSGSNSTVVWNPWVRKSQTIPAFGDKEYYTGILRSVQNNVLLGEICPE